MVEVSTDGGETWGAAEDTSPTGDYSSWLYAWCDPTAGWHTIKVRATDKAGNIEVPGAGTLVFVDIEGEDYFGDLAPYGESDASLNSADINICVNVIMAELGFSLMRGQPSPIDVAPIEICIEAEDGIVARPEPDGHLDVDDINVIIQAALGYITLVAECPE